MARRKKSEIDKAMGELAVQPLPPLHLRFEDRAEYMLEKYREQDALLVAKGFPPTSPWWMKVVEEFYRSGKMTLVLRVGRRGGKSQTLCRIAVLEALHGGHKVPPGDTGYVMIICQDRKESGKRLRTIASILRILGIDKSNMTNSIDEIVLHDRRVGFAVYTASIGGVSGPTAITIICDEVAKWRDGDSDANPATEVIASVMPCMGTMPDARLFLSSSAFGKSDAHAKAYDDGNTNDQMVAFASTWIANPTISEERTHKLAKDERTWLREWKGIPQDDTSAAFDSEGIMRAFTPLRAEQLQNAQRSEKVMVIDAASGGADRFTFGIVSWIFVPPIILPNEISTFTPIPKLHFEHVEAFAKGMTSTMIVDRIAHECRRREIRFVYGDQRDSFQIRDRLSERGLFSYFIPWNNPNKVAAVERLRGWFHDDVLSLPKHEELQRELLRFNEYITPTGSFTYAGKNRTHDDFVALLLTAAICDANQLLGGSPYGYKVEPHRDLSRLAYL
jgi:hypothetical protein